MTATLHDRPDTHPPAAEPSPEARPPRRLHDRRQRFAALGLILMLGCGVGVAALVTNLDTRTSVLALARAVDAGEVLTDAHLRSVEVGADGTANLVAVSRRDEFVGRIAAVPLTAGTLLSPDLFTERAPLGDGEAIVSVTVPDGALPIDGLSAGSTLLLTATPDPADPTVTETLADTRPLVWAAEVFGLRHVEDDAGFPQIALSLRVDTLDAPAVNAAAAADRLRLVLLAGRDAIPAGLLYTDALTPDTTTTDTGATDQPDPVDELTPIEEAGS